MLTPEARARYEAQARLIKSGKAAYQPAKKSRYSKAAENRYGAAPDFL